MTPPSFFDEFTNAWTGAGLDANLTIAFNLFLALILGLLVGYERSFRGRAAGMRTYGMVCMASAAMMVITGHPDAWFGGTAGHFAMDPTRVAQGITTGIGFLGAGVIMRDGLNISGLTTAASIWAVSAIGILVGIGFYGAAVALALLATLLMMYGAKLDAFLPSRHAVAVNLYFTKGFVPTESDLRQAISKNGYSIAKGSFTISKRDQQHEWRFVVVSMGKKKGGSLTNLGKSLATTEGVDSFNLSHARN